MLTVLSWGGLIAALGLGLASLSVQHLGAMNLHSHRQGALNLARSVASQGVERLLSDPTFGAKATQGPNGTQVVLSAQGQAGVQGQLLRHKLAGTPEGEAGLLTFQPDVAAKEGILYSVNNLEGTQPVMGALAQPVPPGTAQLIGEGREGGQVRRVVVVLAIPTFPYAIASAGPISAEGGVTLGAVSKIPTDNIPEDSDLLPADLVSNDATQKAIFLGPDTYVAGDVKATGIVALDPNAPSGSIKVDGVIKSGADPERIPKIPLGDYDPQAQGKPFVSLTSSLHSDPLRVAGVTRHQGALQADGGLTLDGGTLYVDGDLSVRGGLKGKGVLVVTGQVTLEGQSDLESGAGVALLAGKDLRIKGQDSEKSYFQGLVYTEGTFRADRVTILGTLIAGGQPQNSVTLANSRLLKPPPAPAITPPAPPTGGGTGPVGTQVGQVNIAFDPQTQQFQALYNGQQYNFGLGAQAAVYSNVSDLVAYIESQLPSGAFAKSGSELHTYAANVLQALAAQSGTGGQTVPPATVTTIDPSAFLRIQDRIRVMVWKEET